MAKPDDSWLLAIDFPTLFVAADWIEAHCIVPDGDGRGRAFGLYDWQLHNTLHHYRIKPDAIVGQKAAAFHNRRTQIIAAQKTGKGPFTAAIICLEAVGPALFDGWAEVGDEYRCENHGCGCGWSYAYAEGEAKGRPWTTPLIQILATSEDQTANIYRPLKAMILLGPLKELLKVGEEFIRCPNDGLIEQVTSRATSRLGNPITCCVQDETGLYTKNNGLIAVAQTQRRGLAGMGGRCFETTNPYDPAEVSIASMTHKSRAKDIHRFYDEPPTHLDYRKPADRHKIHLYNYRLSPHVDVATIDAEAAELMEEDPVQAERFFGNRIKAAGDNAFDLDAWRACFKEGYAPAHGAHIVAGVDGARFDDALAVIACEVETGFMWPVAIVERPEQADDDYEHDFEMVDAAMIDLFDTYRVVWVFCDPQWIDPLVDRWVARWGPRRIISWTTNRPRAIAFAVRSFHAALRGKSMSHNGDEAFTRHIGNAKRVKVAALDDDGRPMWSIQKDAPKSPRKIDAAMGGVLTWEARGEAIAKGYGGGRKGQRAAFV